MFLLRSVAITLSLIALTCPTPSDAQRRSFEKEARAGTYVKESGNRKTRPDGSRRGRGILRDTWLGMVSKYREVIESGRFVEAEKLASRALAFATSNWGSGHKYG